MSITLYLETNWLVAYILPHHAHHTTARQLKEAADNNKCKIKIPAIVFLEAKHAVQRETNNHAQSIKQIASSLQILAKNKNDSELLKLVQQIQQTEKSYYSSKPLAELQAFSQQCENFSFALPDQEHRLLTELRPQTNLQGKDITDLYILAAIAAHRDTNRTGKAAFLSLNKKEFDVEGKTSKLPSDFYLSRHLVYRSDFLFDATLNDWERHEQENWQPIQIPQKDPQRQKARSILDQLPTSELDAAVKALETLQKATNSSSQLT
jgi:predicted nucleic acid-binding protein